MSYCASNHVFAFALLTDTASVWPARCKWLLPAGPAAVLQPAATASASATPGTISVAGPAEVPGSAGEHRPPLLTVAPELEV